MKVNVNKIIIFLLTIVCLTSVLAINNDMNTTLFSRVYAEEGDESINDQLQYGNKIANTDVPDFYLREYILSIATKKGLTAMYQNMFYGETIIEFSGKDIESLEGLELFNLETVEHIDFSNNDISTIPQKAFYTSKNLSTLNLSGNNLSSVNLELYSKSINLSNNVLEKVNIQDNYLVYLDVSNNKINNSNKITVTKLDSTGNIVDLEKENYTIKAYFNYMAGKSNLTNAYLGIQNISAFKSKTDGYDYEMYAESSAYKFYVYPFEDVCVGKDSSNNPIFKSVKCNLKIYNSQSNTYETIYSFSEIIGKDSYDSYLPKSGYYRLEFLTESGNPIYKLDSNYDIVTEKDYNGNDVALIEDIYKTLNVIVRPYQRNAYLMIGEDVFSIEIVRNGPVDIDFCTPIQDSTLKFKYLINGQGIENEDGEQIPYETQNVYLHSSGKYVADGFTIDKTGSYVITVWISQNGVDSDYITFALKITVPRKLTFENWFYIIASILIVCVVFVFIVIRKEKINIKKEINDFEW